MRQKLREANLGLRLIILGAAAWSIYYSGALAWSVLASDANIALKLLAVFGLTCWYVLHYASGALDALAIVLGLIGYGLIRLGKYLIGGRTKLRDLGAKLAQVLSDDGVATQFEPVGAGTRSWPKVGILWTGSAIVGALVLAIVVMIAVRLVPVEPIHVAVPAPGLSEKEFKWRFFAGCVNCGGDEPSSTELFAMACDSYQCLWHINGAAALANERRAGARK